ncbi:PDZ domain-containing protein [Streptomyces sp. 3MP-14]|uniref:PDZ domain-containing protein n=1 Tax=Streptomyces mimosae TaxID=2586635 RepID=A0A5N6A0A3_9ACTN|nr:MULTISPECIES: S41 family peptidase [Streptomyces]KAB8161449.1 PDZ domain-containing protein [Streptomyces mimosae]KAB8173227.1 PDZ domain-containing protein [Streptomyces sp. 3MP-14]
MSRPSHRGSSRSVRRGAALACVFTGVLVTGAATGSWPEGADGSESTVLASGSGAGFGGEEARGPASGTIDDARRLVSRSGDRWSAAYTAEEYERLRRGLDGEYVGTGIAVLRTADGRIEVSEVHADSPAERAGIEPGDEIRAIDGVPLAGGPVTDVVSRLRGSDRPEQAGPGSTVSLGMERDGRRWELSVERARLTVRSVVVTESGDGVTHIEVDSFTRGSAQLLREAVAEVPADHGIVLDLRGNAGGLLTEAADSASVFLDGGLVATYDVHGEERALHAARGGDTDTPLVVLVDGGTMSSAEMFTGALQDRNRAVIVGHRTFGKGTVQMPSEQPDGSVAELTVGHYVTPSGRTVDQDGIVPDLVVDPGADAEAKARTVLDGLSGGA